MKFNCHIKPLIAFMLCLSTLAICDEISKPEIAFEKADSSTHSLKHKSTEDKSEFKSLEPNPSSAAGLSLLFPGTGQLYSRKYLHTLFFLATEGVLVYYAFDNYKKAEDLWKKRSSLTPGTPEYEKAGADFNRITAERNAFFWILGGVKILDVVDAYVCAHLYNFDKKLNSPEILIVPDYGGVKITFSVRIW